MAYFDLKSISSPVVDYLRKPTSPKSLAGTPVNNSNQNFSQANSSQEKTSILNSLRSPSLTTQKTGSWGPNMTKQTVKAPTATLTTSSAPKTAQPATPSKSFYRVGSDLYDASANRKISSTEWANDWTGRASEVSSPTLQSSNAVTTPKPSSIIPKQPEVKTSAPLSLSTSLPANPYAKQQSLIDSLRKGVVELSAPSEQERMLQDEYNQLKGNAEAGIAGLEGQGRGIPLGLVRGQQGLLEKQANIKEQTLLDRLAAASAQRQAALSAQNLNLGYATQDLATEQARQAELKPFNIGGSLVKLNPTTGQYETVYSAPETQADGFTLSEGQSRYDANGNLIAGSQATVDPLKQRKAELEIAKLEQELSSGGLDSLEQQKKQLELEKLYNEVKGITPQSAGQAEKASQISSLAQELLNSGSLGAAVGPISSRFPTLRGDTADFESKLNQLKSLLTLDNLKLLKGAMSDKDLELLQSAATALNTNMSEQGFKNELQKIISSANATSIQGQGFSQEELDYLRNNGVDVSSFTNDLSMSQNGSNAKSIASAIKQVESGGNYNARGGSGENGAYQFMPSSWSGWAKQYLGNANAPMTPENQDKVAEAKIQDWLNQGYNAQQIALLWNSGKTTPVKGVNKYGVAYDSGAYANKVLNALG